MENKSILPIISLVSAILSVVLALMPCIYIFSLPLAVVAIVLGFIAKSRESNRKMVTVSIVLGFIGLFLGIISTLTIYSSLFKIQNILNPKHEETKYEHEYKSAQWHEDFRNFYMKDSLNIKSITVSGNVLNIYFQNSASNYKELAKKVAEDFWNKYRNYDYNEVKAIIVVHYQEKNYELRISNRGFILDETY